jgi:hypothetical protein
MKEQSHKILTFFFANIATAELIPWKSRHTFAPNRNLGISQSARSDFLG